MKLKKRQVSGREKDEDSIRLLARLRDKLYSENPSVARRAAFNLSWMQEDGLEILKEPLFSGATRKAKSAAAYGLRRMHGRMRKAALEVFNEGLEGTNNDTRKVCQTALSQLGKEAQEKSEGATGAGKIRIKEISHKTKKRKRGPLRISQRSSQKSPQRGRRRTPSTRSR
jgi:hypothetical protein